MIYTTIFNPMKRLLNSYDLISLGLVSNFQPEGSQKNCSQKSIRIINYDHVIFYDIIIVSLYCYVLLISYICVVKCSKMHKPVNLF